MAFTTIIHAQVTITGKVLDKKQNTSLAGATVQVKNTKTTTTTDENGNFSLKAASSKPTLLITVVGFTPQEVKLTTGTSVIISMESADKSMEDVVVVGYQSVQRRKATGAVATLKGKDIENLPATSFDQLLQGRLPGVNVQNFSGEPGSSPSVSVRGNTSVSTSYQEDALRVLSQPLYVIDGVPQPTDIYSSATAGTGTNSFAGLNINEIESIDVLRDAAAAAIYGSRGQNGVIIIKTKRGKAGTPSITVSGFKGITSRPKLRKTAVGLLERREKVRVFQEAFYNNYATSQNLSFILSDSLNPDFNNATDWQNLFYQAGSVSRADFSISGGTEYNTYRLATGMNNEEGVIRNTGARTFTLNFNSNIRTKNNFLTIIPNIRLARIDRRRGTGDANPTAIVGANMPTSLIKADAAIMKQLLGRYDKVLDVNISNQINADMTVQLKLSRDILFNSTNAAQYAIERRDWARPSELNSNNGNSSYSYATFQQNYTSSNYLTWNPKFGDHEFNTILGSEMVYTQFQSTTAQGSRGSNDQVQTVAGFANGPYLYGGSDYTASGLFSLYGRTTYEYKGRYIFSVLYRGDAASRFGKNNKWGYFPSGSFAWLVSDEKFMAKYASWLSLLKLRASYGTVGNLPGSAYLQYSLYSTGASGYESAGLAPKGYDGVVSVTPQFSAGGLSQNNLTWEKTHSWNLGADIALFRDKIYLQLDAYNKESQAVLANVALQSTTGVSSAQVNALGVRNAGVEANLRLSNILPSASALKWEIMANASYNQNMIMTMQNSGRDLVFAATGRFNSSHILTRGMPINTFYLLTSTGPYATDNDVPSDRFTGNVLSAQAAYDAYNSGAMFRAGEMGFLDIDGNGRINPFNGGIDGDKLPIGNPNPKVTGGITQNFYWKNFVLSVFGTFTLGRDVLNLYEADLYSRYGDDGTGQRMAMYAMSDLSGVNMWRKPGDVAVYPKIDIGTYRYYNREDQTFYMVKGDYFKVKNISLRYNAGNQLLQKLRMKRAGVYVLADNLFRFQASKKLPDAENVNAYGEYSGALYPIPTKFTIGFDFGF